jgi:hypothetical protein
MFSLSSCGVFKELKEGLDDALIITEDFCQALADDDIESAKGFLHPDSIPKESELLSFIIKLEEVNDIDFSLGVAFKTQTNFSSTYYDSSYGGSVHKLEYEIVVGGVPLDCFFVIVKNDNGYGIYSFGIQNTNS